MKKILFLTNSKNSRQNEDAYLIDILRSDFEIVVSHPLDCKKYLESVDGVIIRNIWPTHEYLAEWREVERLLRASGKPVYNPLTGKGDQKGKDHVVELFSEGYQVIPTVDSLNDLGKLPDCEYYFIKPKMSCDGTGSKKLTRAGLETADLTDYVIQPFVEFESEPSFFYLDNHFSYAITMPNRLSHKTIEIYRPTAAELQFAQSFVDWNALPYGLQRIDALRTKDGKLLLTEIEDESETLYLLDLKEPDRVRITHEIVRSMKAVFV
ncbi:MAG: hypothetical protein Q7S50_04135 [bacterium]|nr:hypothetical protein [bacterium]